jgi:hypothetical protein
MHLLAAIVQPSSSGMLTKSPNRFAAFIKRHPADQPKLPAVRTTNVVGFGKILDARELRPNEEGLLYFFYGKPSFKIPKRHSVPTRILGDAAVCFVFDLTTLPEIHRIFALDTGAYHGKRYDNYLPNGVLLSDFELPIHPETLQQLVSAFFGSNVNYYEGVAKESLKLDALDRASEVYANIVRSAVSELDERACTCELQFKQSILLSTARLVTVIIPSRLWDEAEVKTFFHDLGVKPILYRFRRAKPEERTEVIYEKLGEYYESCQVI